MEKVSVPPWEKEECRWLGAVITICRSSAFHGIITGWVFEVCALPVVYVVPTFIALTLSPCLPILVRWKIWSIVHDALCKKEEGGSNVSNV